MEDDIRDNEYLFKDTALTDRERKQLAYDKEILNLAQQKMNITVDPDP